MTSSEERVSAKAAKAAGYRIERALLDCSAKKNPIK